MVPTRTNANVADRAAKSRAVVCVALSVALFMSQAASLDSPGNSVLPPVRSEAFYLWAATLLLALMLAAANLHGRAVREMLNDEGASSHRLRALGVGFWSALVTSALVWSVSEPLTGAEGARLIVTVAASAALLKFGWLEWRSLR
jgi:hypothetical protein